MKGIFSKKNLTTNEMFVVYIILILSLLIGLVNPAFFTIDTVFGTARSILITMIFALCEMVIIISGGIDVSFPAIACFSLYFTISIMNIYHINSIVFAFVLSGLLGFAWGVINGLLIGKFKIPALIATLGTSSLANGTTLAYSGGRDISNIPSAVDALSHKFLFSIQNATGGKSTMTIFIILPILLCFFIHWILKYTMLGRKIYAVGGDSNAARIAGINVIKTQFIIYMFTGFLTGIAGISNAILMRNAHPSNLMGAEMMVIAAVVIGGTRITGGHGTVIGTVLGVLLIGLVSNNLIMLGIPNYWQTFAVGLIIVIGTSITSLRAKKIALSPKI
ncbi:ribose transport system permease protein RbsC [Clostridium magnum DSM 2767]|uniref:Ribose transport system permease protein RbsC n=2 Tax=Clostridium magnum TaxID=33954 RepID=A0A162T9M5_9CLOT|nr:ribose transport system permease protein RbsC [Clostridium magnum DSM 2767]SHH11176.1 simple sugar transport system permease protein [Clostridium magnum DSM 2767]